MADILRPTFPARKPRPAEAVAGALSRGDIDAAAALTRAALADGLEEGLPAVSLFWCRARAAAAFA